MQAWKFYFITFGCKVNQYETQSLREAWQARGGVECDDPAQADVVCVNSCAITARGERDARNAVFRLRRAAPAARLILTGCAARLFEDFRRHGHEDCVQPDLVLPQGDKRLLLAGPWTEEAQAPAGEAQAPSYPPFAISGFRRARPVLKVQDGCSHGCAYCIVPLTRGPARSRPPRDCLAEMRRLLEAGYREIMISGINLRQYAMRDEGCRDFWDLLSYLDRELSPEWGSGARPDPARFRISSVEPAQLTERGIATLAETRMVCPHLHLSLQSGSADVLKAMRRGHYTPEALLSAVEGVAKLWPRFGLGADILMGFPGETEAHVLETLEVVRSLPLTYAHVFPYSARPGTVAAELPDQVEKAVRQERAARVRAVVEAKREAFWKDTLTCERLLVALDCNEDAGAASGQHGVDECYVPCRLRTPLRGEGHTLIPVRPVSVSRKGVIVEPVRS